MQYSVLARCICGSGNMSNAYWGFREFCSNHVKVGAQWTMKVFSQIPAVSKDKILPKINYVWVCECWCLWVKVWQSSLTFPTESHQCWVRSCLPVASITGKPQSQTAQLIDLASAPAQLCRPVPWDKGRHHGTCTALSHRGELEPCLSPLHQSLLSRCLGRNLWGPNKWHPPSWPKYWAN